MKTMKTSLFNKISVGACAIAMSVGALAGGGGSGGGDDQLPAPSTCEFNCGFDRGPTPTLSYLQNTSGPYSVSTINVPSSIDGFGGGTIYYPPSVSGEMAAVAVSPGFTANQSAISYWGPALASHGFVVITIDTNSRFDQPVSRGRQLDSALSYLINQSSVRNRIDDNRLAAMGHSMGGGGALQSASRNRISAAMPLAPWTSGSNPYNQINVPTLIFACENDGVASVNGHASPFYNRIPNSTDKAFVEVNDGPHNCANGNNAGSSRNSLLSTYGVSWMKRFLDKDSRYNQFLCGPNHTANSQISEFRSTCNF